MGSAEQIEADTKPLPGFKELGMVTPQDLFWRNSFLFGADGYGRAMRVTAGYHQNFVTQHPVVTGEDVGGQIATCNMTHVQRPIGVWPGDADKYTLGQMKCPYLFGFEVNIIGSDYWL